LPVDWVVLGADELPLGDELALDESVREAAASGSVEILTETQFWHRLGWVENEHNVRRLYTPAMLAQLLNVPVAVVRRWHRRGLIVPTREVHRLPYFDFQEVATARRLAELLTAGATPTAIERQLAQLAVLVPEVERPLAQLSVIVEGRALLLRQGEGLVEPGGQMRFDFPDDEVEAVAILADNESTHTRPAAIPIRDWLAQQHEPLPTCDELVAIASELEDEGETNDAIATYRLALAVGGPRPELCFRLAELLYMTGDVTAARERYSMAIELDENYVEARANLACVLAETGQEDLAIAAFQGALRSHPDYPDAHYHLAVLLDRHGDDTTARHHWERFLTLASESPWADEARERLGVE
ncbi:MAG: tetratricopeptide repeat protein, partial [Planctomycetales bacterium]|nr:tetratricopeptide repeat protein [Planctomycetales bacterium]